MKTLRDVKIPLIFLTIVIITLIIFNIDNLFKTENVKKVAKKEDQKEIITHKETAELPKSVKNLAEQNEKTEEINNKTKKEDISLSEGEIPEVEEIDSVNISQSIDKFSSVIEEKKIEKKVDKESKKEVVEDKNGRGKLKKLDNSKKIRRNGMVIDINEKNIALIKYMNQNNLIYYIYENFNEDSKYLADQQGDPPLSSDRLFRLKDRNEELAIKKILSTKYDIMFKLNGIDRKEGNYVKVDLKNGKLNYSYGWLYF